MPNRGNPPIGQQLLESLTPGELQPRLELQVFVDPLTALAQNSQNQNNGQQQNNDQPFGETRRSHLDSL